MKKRIARAVVTPKMYADRKGWGSGRLGAGQWDKLIEIAGKTPVTRTLAAGAEITTTRAGA